MPRETKFLLSRHKRMSQSELLLHRVPLFADIRVFSYPLLLTSLYVYGITKNSSKEKHLALYLGTSTVAVFVVNYIIKHFIHRVRPYEQLGLAIPKEELTLSSLPIDSFPSDHAGVSATIAASLLFWGVKHKKKSYIYLSIPFRLMWLSMSLGRITIAIHRPTDIIAGTVIGISVAAILLYNKKIWSILKQIFNWGIKIEKKIISTLLRNR